MAVAVDQEGWLVAFYTSHRHEHRCLSRRRLGSRLGSRHLVVRHHDLAFCTLMGGEVLCASLFCSLLIWFWACFSACCCHRSGAGFLAELACRGPSAIWVPGWVVGFDSHEMAVIRGIIWSWWAIDHWGQIMKTLTRVQLFAPGQRGPRKTKDWFERAKLVVAAARDRAAVTAAAQHSA